MSYFIAVDIGTTNCKLVIVDGKGRTVYSFKEAITSIQPNEGWHEQDAELIFQILLRLLKQSLSLVEHEQITCISFSAAMHSILAIDKNGMPVINAITWADTRSKIYAQQLRNTEIGKNIYRQTGTAVHAMSPLCKLVFIKNEMPQLLVETHKFISIKEYIFHRLFGKFLVDVGIASATGLYDFYNGCWCKEAMAIAGIDESKLSDVVSATHIEKELMPGIRKELGLKKSMPFVIGGNDGCLANLGCGALNTNQAALTIGTSGAVRATIPKSKIEDLNGLFRYLLTDDLYVTGAAINNGGITLQWFAENFLQTEILTDEDLNSVLKIAEQAPACAEGLIFLPYLLGERGTIWNEDATAMFYGLRMIHKKEHLTRAVIEGISFSLLQILKAIENTNIAIDKIYVSGIVTKSEWWMQLLADIFGKAMVLSDESDASAIGAVFLGMYATGAINDLSEAKSFITTTKTFEPDEVINKLYQQQYKLYVSLYPILSKM